MPITNLTKFDIFYDPKDTKERCGFVLKGNRLVEVKNIHPEPELGFEICPESILRHESELKGTWHTHPGGTRALSARDRACFLQWPDLEHYIIGTNGVQRYYVEDGIVYNAD